MSSIGLRKKDFTFKAITPHTGILFYFIFSGWLLAFLHLSNFSLICIHTWFKQCVVLHNLMGTWRRLMNCSSSHVSLSHILHCV